MASVWMMSFDWDGLDEILARPAAELAAGLAKHRGREPVPDLPRAEPELATYLRGLLGADDWYAGKSPREARAIDRVISYLFHNEKPLKPLKLKPLSEGVSMEVLGVATSRWEVDADRDTPRSRALSIRRASSKPVDEASELANLGSRPFRHPSWDREAAEALLALHNPFLEGGDAAYFPEYSIHSPEQVRLLRRDLERVVDRVRSELGRVKSGRVREAAIANFEDDLAGPIEEAAASGRAVYARWDY